MMTNQVDSLDEQILAALQENGRLTMKSLAEQVGLSSPAMIERVRRLEERGVIQGYRAVVDQNALGRPLLAFISVTPLDPAAPDDVADRLRDIQDIEACHSVAGEESYILKARVSTPGDLEDLLARVRSGANVSTRTTVVLSTPWEERPPPVSLQ